MANDIMLFDFDKAKELRGTIKNTTNDIVKVLNSVRGIVAQSVDSNWSGPTAAKFKKLTDNSFTKINNDLTIYIRNIDQQIKYAHDEKAKHEGEETGSVQQPTYTASQKSSGKTSGYGGLSLDELNVKLKDPKTSVSEMRNIEREIAALGMDNHASVVGETVHNTEATLLEKLSQIWDPITSKRIETLHPAIRGLAADFILAAQAEGLNLRITDYYRSIEEQDALYAQGRTAPGDIVTWAKGGESYHNFGLAFDVVEIKDGKAIYDGDWNRIAKIGKQVGFEWGGDWQKTDKPHFQMPFGYTTSNLRQLINNGNTSSGYVALNQD